MSSQMGTLLAGALDELRYEPIGKRIRAVLGGGTAVDSTRAVLVWEPRRIVPSYAVPAGDIRGELAPAAAAAAGDREKDGAQMPALSSRPVLTPDDPFAAHTAEGQPVDVRVHGDNCPGAVWPPWRWARPGLSPARQQAGSGRLPSSRAGGCLLDRS